MRGYVKGILDFGELRFWGFAAPHFEETAVILFGDHRDTLLCAQDA